MEFGWAVNMLLVSQEGNGLIALSLSLSLSLSPHLPLSLSLTHTHMHTHASQINGCHRSIWPRSQFRREDRKVTQVSVSLTPLYPHCPPSNVDKGGPGTGIGASTSGSQNEPWAGCGHPHRHGESALAGRYS